MAHSSLSYTETVEPVPVPNRPSSNMPMPCQSNRKIVQVSNKKTTVPARKTSLLNMCCKIVQIVVNIVGDTIS